VTTRNLDNHPMADSRLAGREVSTWSEEWSESEIAYLAGMKPEKVRAMLYGMQVGEGESARGISTIAMMRRWPSVSAMEG